MTTIEIIVQPVNTDIWGSNGQYVVLAAMKTGQEKKFFSLHISEKENNSELKIKVTGIVGKIIHYHNSIDSIMKLTTLMF